MENEFIRNRNNTTANNNFDFESKPFCFVHLMTIQTKSMAKCCNKYLCGVYICSNFFPHK